VAPENTILLLPKWLTGYNSAKSYLLSVSWQREIPSLIN
jgi:hypothetical protein